MSCAMKQVPVSQELVQFSYIQLLSWEEVTGKERDIKARVWEGGPVVTEDRGSVPRTYIKAHNLL